MRLAAVLLLATLAAACSGTGMTAASQDQPQYVGTWAQRDKVAGTLFVRTLSVQPTERSSWP